MQEFNPDVVCLQKVRCNSDRGKFQIEGYKQLWEDCDLGDWSGVMTYVKIESEEGEDLRTSRYTTESFLSENGHLQAFNFKEYVLVNAYVPFANKDIEGAIEYRKKWDEMFREFICGVTANYPVIICGDLNVVHTQADTCENKLEQNRPCFYKWERDNFNSLLEKGDLIDAFRSLHEDDEQTATFYGNFRHLGIGNRIDYFLTSFLLFRRINECCIINEFVTTQSDPILLDIDTKSINGSEYQC